MKKITLLFFVVICIFSTVNAQKTQSSQLDLLQEKMASIGHNIGNINDYYTSEELALIRQHFYKPSNTDRGVNLQSIAYGGRTTHPNDPNEFSSFDTEDGVLNYIANSPITTNFETAGAVDPNNVTTAYVLDDAGEFFSVDVTTGVYTALGTIPGAWTGLEFDPTSGILYGIQFLNSLNKTSLSSIDVVNVTSTLIDIIPTMETGVGIAIGSNGNAYTWDIVDDNLYSIDLTNGASTLIGSIGFDSSFGQGFFWDPATDTFYMTSVDVGNGGINELRSVDVATGATTVIGVFPESQVAWASSSYITPIGTDHCGAYTSNPSLIINDGNDPSDVITVPASPGIINDLNIVLDISHTWIADLEITLTSPAGTVVNLLFDPCGNNDDLSILLNDEGLAIVCASPTIGSVIPDNPLSTFDGEAFQGDWTLSVVDDSVGNDGVLNTWCLVPSLTFPCGNPTTGVASNITHESADLGWTAGPDAESLWDVEWGVVGFTPGTGTQSGMTEDTSNNPFVATGLVILTDYEFYVKAVCNNNDNSGWAGPFTFSTITQVPPECGENYYDTGGIAYGYNNNELYTTTITPDIAGEVVTVTFTYVDIETAANGLGTDGCYDFFTIYDGPDTNSPVLAVNICGEESGDGNVPDPPSNELKVGDSFTSSHASGALTFVFTSDNTTNETGWEADVTCASTISVSDLEVVGFNYYPNPVSNELFLAAKENITNVKIFNMLGQVVISAEPSSIETTISMSNLATGPYFVKAQIGSTVSAFKVIKK